MHFNKLKTYFALFLSSLFVTSCSFFVDEVKVDTEVSYQEKAGSCVAQANDMLSAYFDMKRVVKISDVYIDDFAKCYQETLQSIIVNTKSGRANPDEYIPENIDGLIALLHPDISIGLERTQFFFQIKYFLIGGKPETLSKSEMESLRLALPKFAALLKQMNPHRALIFNLVDQPRTSEAYRNFDNVFDQLLDESLGLLKSIKGPRTDRSLNIRKMGDFVISEFFSQEEENAKENLDLLVEFKNFVLNKEGDGIESDDFSLFLKQSLRVYRSLNTFNDFIKDDNIFTNLGHILSFVTQIPGQIRDSSVFTTVTLEALKQVVDDLTAVVRDASLQQANDRIPSVKLEKLILSLDKAGFMDGGNLKAPTLVEFIQEFSAIWLGPGRAKTSDLTSFKADYVQRLVNQWHDRQVGINRLFVNGEDQQISLRDTVVQNRDESQAKFWVSLYEKVSTYQWNSFDQVSYRKDLADLTYSEMTASNSVALMVELFMRPYNAAEPNFLNFKINIEQAQDVYEVIRILGVELAFMDARVLDSGKRSFGETNNFSTQLKNDSLMDFYEGYEYLAVTLSSGRLADRIHGGVDENYQLIHEDVNQRKVIDAAYFRGYLLDNFPSFIGHFKTISNFWQSANNDERKEFIQGLEYAARAGVISDKPFDLGEIRTLSTVLSYAEAIFYNFDRDADGIAEETELRAAERHFRSLVKEFILKSASELLLSNKDKIISYMHPDASDAQLQKISQQKDILDKMAVWLSPKIFIYLLNTGTIPSSIDWTLYRLLGDKGEAAKYRKTHANALAVIKVFSALAKVSREAHIQDLEEFLGSQFVKAPREGLVREIDRSQQPTCLSREEKNLRSRDEPAFCQLSLLLYCNEAVNDQLYTELRDGRYDFFPRELWNFASSHSQADQRSAIVGLMKTLEARLRDENNRFAFQCLFPHLGEDYGQEDKSKWDSIKGWFKSNVDEPDMAAPSQDAADVSPE